MKKKQQQQQPKKQKCIQQIQTWWSFNERQQIKTGWLKNLISDHFIALAVFVVRWTWLTYQSAFTYTQYFYDQTFILFFSLYRKLVQTGFHSFYSWSAAVSPGQLAHKSSSSVK